MAFGHGTKAKVLANGYDVTSFLSSVDLPATADVAEVSTLGVASKAYVPGLKDATAQLEGFFDGAADAIDDIVSSILGALTPSIWSYFPAGDALGARAVGLEGIETAYGVNTVIEDAQKVSVAVQSSRGTETGVSLHALAEETTSGDETAVDNGASSSAGGVGYLQVTAATGAGTVKIQHSTDNAVFVDLITFTAASDRTAERKSVTGTVNRYLRTSHAPGTSITYAAHFARN